MAGYSGTPLAKKIGIKAGHRVLLVGAPKDFPLSLGALPNTATIISRGAFDVAIVFVLSAADLELRFARLQSSMAEDGMIWAAWPKKASGVVTDLAENKVRDIGLTAGLVDIKVCAIDDTWSGLKFVIRVADRRNTAAKTKKAAAK
jgi:hypothetical protein